MLGITYYDPLYIHCMLIYTLIIGWFAYFVTILKGLLRFNPSTNPTKPQGWGQFIFFSIQFNQFQFNPILKFFNSIQFTIQFIFTPRQNCRRGIVIACVFLSVCPSVRPSVCPSVFLSVRPSVRPSVCLSVCRTTLSTR